MVLLTAASLAAALKSPVVSLDPSDPIQGMTLGQLTYQGMQDPRFAARVSHFLADHGVNHPQKADLRGKSPIEAARSTLMSEVRDGRTPAEWIKLAKAENLLALQPVSVSHGDLVSDVARLDEDAGAPLTSYQRAQLERDAAALPVDVRESFADVVHAVLVAWEAQAPIAAREVQKLHSLTLPTDLLLSDADRESSIQNALGLLAAENAFREQASRLVFPQSSTPLFRDPEGLIILGSVGSDSYVSNGILRDPILIVDPSGDDSYRTSAGGACPDVLSLAFRCNGLVVSTVLDLSGNDSYAYAGTPMEVQGSGGLGGIGILVDVAGDDHYQSDFVRSRSTCCGYYLDAGSQGNGFAGVGLLLDGIGNDVYVATVTDALSDAGIWDMSQGFGNVGGVGIFADGAGNNQLLNYGFNGGCSGCFQGLYPGGTGLFAGVGVLSSTGAGASKYYGWDNATSTDFYAWGFAAFGGTGIFFDDGGDDDYAASQNSSANQVEVPLLNCAFGTASYAGLGIFVDMGGNDRYFSDTISTGLAGHPTWGSVFTQSEGYGGPAEGEGLFVDASGDDEHFMQAHPNNGPNAPQYTTGRGVTLHGGSGLTGNTFGIYLDLGGRDTYTGAAPSTDGALWGMGADINTDGSVPTPNVLGGL